MKLEEVRNQKLEYLNSLLESNPFDLDNYLSEKEEYKDFCDGYNLSNGLNDNFYKKESELLEHLFVVSSIPLRYNVDLEIIKTAVNKIDKDIALEENEIKAILEFTVDTARQKLEDGWFNLETDSLQGACGVGQALTYYILEEMGIKTTLNNIGNISDIKTRHAFLTCFFKTMDNGKEVNKQYLIDTTYRQFFTYQRCNRLRFYNEHEDFKNKVAPDAGYFLSQFAEGKEFAEELLKKGYIELNENNARLYGLGFACSELSFDNAHRIKEITSHTGKEYIEAINNPLFQAEIDCDYEELYEKNEFSHKVR